MQCATIIMYWKACSKFPFVADDEVLHRVVIFYFTFFFCERENRRRSFLSKTVFFSANAQEHLTEKTFSHNVFCCSSPFSTLCFSYFLKMDFKMDCPGHKDKAWRAEVRNRVAIARELSCSQRRERIINDVIQDMGGSVIPQNRHH